MRDPDEELVQLCKDGDMIAFNSLVQRYKTPLINFIYRFLNDYETAEDIAQEVFIRIYKSIERYDCSKSAFRLWMYKIATNLCKNEVRNRKRRSKVIVQLTTDEVSIFDDIFDVRDSSPLPDAKIIQSELNSALLRAIAELPIKYRTVLILHDIQGVSYEDVSKIIGRSIGTVKSRLNRARLMLKDKVMSFYEKKNEL